MSVMMSLALALLAVVLLFPAAAHAYVDPGTGSMVLQGVIAAVLGLGLTLKLYWRKIRKRLTGKRERDDETDAEQ
jgi:hypothetical protein